MRKAIYHLPGLFEFQELYKRFLPIYRNHREYFYDWCQIGSIYGAPKDCLWAGGRIEWSDTSLEEALGLLEDYAISARLTFSNSLLREKDLSDFKCNQICRLLETGCHSDLEEKAYKKPITHLGNNSQAEMDCREQESKQEVKNGIILHSDLLLDYIKETYPSLYLVSSTTKVLMDFEDFYKELQRKELAYVVPDFRLNKQMANWDRLSQEEKDKVEFLCNECCWTGCKDRKACYENVSRQNLGEDVPDFPCKSPESEEGYRFSKAMESPAFIGIKEIQETYLPMGYTNFKIEGRGLGSAMVLEFLLYYMVRPEYQLKVREAIYLDSMLDLF